MVTELDVLDVDTVVEVVDVLFGTGKFTATAVVGVEVVEIEVVVSDVVTDVVDVVDAVVDVLVDVEDVLVDVLVDVVVDVVVEVVDAVVDVLVVEVLVDVVDVVDTVVDVLVDVVVDVVDVLVVDTVVDVLVDDVLVDVLVDVVVEVVKELSEYSAVNVTFPLTDKYAFLFVKLLTLAFIELLKSHLLNVYPLGAEALIVPCPITLIALPFRFVLPSVIIAPVEGTSSSLTWYEGKT